MAENDLTKLYGFYRAKVINNKDPNDSGRVKVWIPDVMPKISIKKGIWALPANNAVGGRNMDGEDTAYFAGQCLIPPKGTYCWVFFECGNPSRPFYFGSLDLTGSARALPECRTGDEPFNKWVIFKSPSGRCITISDDQHDARVEITGKKRSLTNPPDGDKPSVFEIDKNQTTILLDERIGSEKILIRSYKGDFINFDISNQKLEIRVRDALDLVAVGNLNIYSDSNITLTAKETLTITAGMIDIRSATATSVQAAIDTTISSYGSTRVQGMTSVEIQSSGLVNLDGAVVNAVSGASNIPPIPDLILFPVLPSGKRNTLLQDIDALKRGEKDII